MRADRLIRIVLRLQDQSAVSASTLARELEVSTRTIRRDMESLSAAGVPVHATRGGTGGWSLIDGYRTSLTGLTPTEALATVIGLPRGILTDLGLADPGEDLTLKLLAAVAPAAREQAEHARQRIHIDPDLYWEPTASNHAPVLRQVLEASWDNHMVEIRYGSSDRTIRVAPYGLVRKGTRWYVVAKAGDKARTYRISRIHHIEATGSHFARPTNFDLASHWQQTQDAYAQRFGTFSVRLRIRGEALIRAGWTYAKSKSLATPDPDGWVEAAFDTEDWDGAVGLIGALGSDVIIRSPERLRQHAIANAARLLQLNR